MRIPDDIDFADYIQLVGELEAQEIHPADYWMDKLLDRVENGYLVVGDTMPWSKTHDRFRFRAGEMTLWGGMNGHRKSMFLGQVMTHLAKTRKVAIASLEMSPEETLFRMCCQSGGVISPSSDYVRKWATWAGENILIYDQLDKVAGEKILGFIHYCAKVLECKHVVIDSLTKCGIASDDRNGEKDFIDRLQWAAKTLKCHIHLVVHVRKPQSAGEEYIPTKFDVRGAGELVDMADNLILLWKDKKRERLAEDIEMNFGLDIKQKEYYESHCDQLAIVAKQRHGRFEGTFNFWMDKSMQFTSQEGKKTIMVDL